MNIEEIRKVRPPYLNDLYSGSISPEPVYCDSSIKEIITKWGEGIMSKKDVEDCVKDINTEVQKQVEDTLKDFIDFMINEKLGFPTARSKEEAFRIQRDMYGVVIKTYLSQTKGGKDE